MIEGINRGDITMHGSPYYQSLRRLVDHEVEFEDTAAVKVEAGSRARRNQEVTGLPASQRLAAVRPRQAPRIVLGVTGSIAAYKALEIVRRLKQRGAQVSVVMTRSAQKLVTPLSFESVSGNRVYRDMWSKQRDRARRREHRGRWSILTWRRPRAWCWSRRRPRISWVKSRPGLPTTC